MAGVYKVRAYCENRECDYVHEPDVIRAVNHASAYACAMHLNGQAALPACPVCGHPLRCYPFCSVGAILEP